jgi:plastocyanin
MNMSRIIGTLVVGVLLVLGGCSPTSTAPASKAPTTALIKVESGDDAVESWRPMTAVVSVGGVVTWLNSGYGNHYVISGEGLFNLSLSPGQSFKYTFTHGGNFTFHDDLKNPYSEVGTVMVQ